MPASYPNSVKSFIPQVDLVSIVDAIDVNDAYDEIVAIETAIGPNPATSDAWGSDTFSSSTTSWGTLKARIQNIEHGVYKAITDRISKAGGDTITASGASVIPLSLKGASSQSANLFEVKNSSDSILSFLSASGEFQAVKIDGGTP